MREKARSFREKMRGSGVGLVDSVSTTPGAASRESSSDNILERDTKERAGSDLSLSEQGSDQTEYGQENHSDGGWTIVRKESIQQFILSEKSKKNFIANGHRAKVKLHVCDVWLFNNVSNF